MSEDNKANIDKHLEWLCEILSLDDALLTELHGEKVIEAIIMEGMLAISNLYERNLKFLNWLKFKSSDVFKICMDKLRQHHQAYIANLLEGTPGELPLDRGLKEQLRRNITSLSELIDANSGIVEKLWSWDAISSRERERLNSLNVESDKSLKLLNLISKKSDRTYTCFLEALKKTNQGHIIECLQNGELAKFHIEFLPTSNCTSDDLSNFEAILNEKFNAIAKAIKPSEVDETVLQLTKIFSEKIKIIESKQKQSIVLFLWCRDNEAATKLLLMFESRQLERKLEEICSCLTISLNLPKVLIRVSMETEFLLSLESAALLRNSDTMLSLKYEELEQKFTQLTLYAKQVEDKNVSLQSANGELQAKIGELDDQLSAAKSATGSLKSENLEMRHTLRSMEKVMQILAQQIDNAPKLETLILSDEITIFGMAYLNTTIYLLSSEWIYAHEYPNLRSRNNHDIKIPEIGGPCDMAACQKGQCLYISDHKGRCIWRIQINDKEQRPSKWLTDIEEPFTLSVSSDGCLLIPKSSPYPCIICYNMRGALIKTICLPMGIGVLTHAIKTTTNKYVVSFFDEDGIIDNDHRIYEFEDTGKSIEDLDMKRRLDISSVSSMASGDDNWVLVASRDDNKIILCDGLFVCDVITYQKDSIQRPLNVCYIKDNLLSNFSIVFLHETEDALALSTCNLSLNMTCVLEDLNEPDI